MHNRSGRGEPANFGEATGRDPDAKFTEGIEVDNTPSIDFATGAVAPQQDIKQKKQAFFVFIGQFNGKLRLAEIRQQTQVVTGKASAIAVTNSGKTPSIAVNQLRDSTPTFIVH